MHKKLLRTEVLMTAALVLFIALTLKKCVRDDVALSTLETKILSVTEDNNMQKSGAMKLRALYGLTQTDYEEVVLYVPKSNMDAQELLLVKCKTEEDTGAVKAAAEKRIAYLKSIFESYGVEQMALINRAKVDVQGKYVLYASARESEKAEECFRSILTGKGD